ncbi:MAG: non-canonical purine NTP pyrophosphatase [Pirellulales bacterium]
MKSRPLLVLGTRNRKKGLELAELLVPVGLEVRTLADFPQAIEVVEDGETFTDNAVLKATVQARHLGMWVLGEDSGLAVDALQGKPGVYSARYSGAGATDESNNQFLMAQLGDTPPERRTAHYVCHAVLSDPAGNVCAQSEGRCNGRLRFAGSGTGGFGYDPFFEIVEYHRTFGELGSIVKASLSHRARALRQLIPQLVRLIDSGQYC